ncbi:MAG: hypothetical protein Q9227_002050 [Pyrenula ochraceoflavens]
MSEQSQMMKAVLWEGIPYQMVVREIPRPKIQAATDVIVKVVVASICGSDLHTYHGTLEKMRPIGKLTHTPAGLYGGSDVPYPMGHEAIGVVMEVGNQVQNYKVGDRVVVPDAAVTSATAAIAYGAGNAYAPQAADPGGCQAAEYVRVPAADTVLLSVPQGNDHELDYLTIADIFYTAWSSISSTGFQPGDTVAVYGAGPVGLLAAYSALLRGASKVYSIDHVAARLEKAKSIGAISIDLTAGDPADQILKLEPGGVNRASDCVGFECLNTQLKPQEDFVVNDMIKVTAQGGGIAVTGVYWNGPRDKGEPNQDPKYGTIKFDIAAWWIKNIVIGGGGTIAGSQGPALRDLIAAGRASPGFVFDRSFTIDEAPDAYRLFDEKKIEKAAIRF